VTGTVQLTGLLTAVAPTRNRPALVGTQLALFARAGVTHPIVIADSSDPEQAAAIRTLSGGRADYRTYPPTMTLYDKLDRVLAAVETPYVLLLSEKKLTFPHAMDLAVAYLETHADFVAAHGYVLDFRQDGTDIDVIGVRFFAPSLADDSPLQRYYHLMRRYQPGHFAVLRTEALRRAISLSTKAPGAIFQEVILMAALALQGKVARLRNVFTFQGPDISFHPIGRTDPTRWFMEDAATFFSHYRRYRRLLMQFANELGIAAPAGTRLGQLIDVINAVWLNRNFDNGMLNHTARLLLGDDLPPLAGRAPPKRQGDTGPGDVVHCGANGRRYIWRRAVLEAGPREEITISADEMIRVMEQLEGCFSTLNRSGTAS
jgi:glycosyltransferase domain-containing protein